MKKLHRWNISVTEAIELQKKLAGKVLCIPLKRQPTLIAGLDCAFTKDGKNIIAAAIVLKLPDFHVVETKTIIRKVTFPYIPGLLSFREAPACISVVEKLRRKPDVFLIDGHGIAHPRRLGLAAHLGLFFNAPTIGCAKSRLTGTFKEPALEKGSHTPLEDKGQVIGALLRTRTNVKPVFVSVGNRCTLADAIKITLDCAVKYRLPEPTRLAHNTVSKLRSNT